MSHNNYTDIFKKYKGFIIKLEKNNEDTDILKLRLELPKVEHKCPRCAGHTSRIKDYRVQKVKEMPILGENVELYIKKRRYVCPHCGKTFYENNPILSRYQRNTKIFNKYMFKEFQNSQSFTAISKRFRVSVTTVIRRFDYITHLTPQLPNCLSIDEFRGNAGGEKYQCNLSDPINKKILDILPSRKSEDLFQYFNKFSAAIRANIKVVVMDMSTLFRSVMSQAFPNAQIVADKFHVIRSVTWAMENVRKRIQKVFYKTKRKWFKRSKSLLTKPRCKLKTEERLELDRILNSSQELDKAYWLKESFYKVFRCSTKVLAKEQLNKWLMMVERSKINEFQRCKTSFIQWGNEITNVIECKVTNGFTEGIHNKIKVLKRISYGVRNFERFRNRILYLCA